MTKTLKTVTLGCKVNQYETEYVRQGFQRLGYRDATDGEPVDLCLVNSCTVTAESEAKSRKAIRRLAKAHPRAEIIVMGCYTARAPAEVALLPGVVEVVADKRDLPGLLRRRGLCDVPDGIDRFDSRRRALVKVQDGCRMKCSYCIVPLVRPYTTSRPANEILEEVRRLVAHGHREIVLTGIHLGDYGRGERGEGRAERAERDDCRERTSNDRDEGVASGGTVLPSPFPLHPSLPSRPVPLLALTALLRRITDLDGDFRVRLSSIEATEVTPELIALMAKRRDRICPHLHLPLQSGSDAVLRRMNRREPVGRFAERCREIRAALAPVAITTDVIVGFPGETEADFAATCRAIEEVEFAKVHIFRFSPRVGTPAAVMPDRVTERIAQQRAAKLGEIGELLADRHLRKLLGRRQRVLVEMRFAGRPGWMSGTADDHSPVAVPGEQGLIGQFVLATAERSERGWLWAANPV
jgi:threonylcarbamoyladenosine tRNA methylthiotransferase MtaB